MSESPRSSFSLSVVIARVRRLFPWWHPVQPPVVVEDPDRHGAERLRDQVGVIRRAFAEAWGDDGEVAVAGPKGSRGRDEEATFLYHPRRVLVRDGDDFALLTEFFGDPVRRDDFEGELRREGEPVPGSMVTVEVPLRRDGGDAVLVTLAELDRAHPDRAAQRKPVAQPDHVLYVTSYGRLCPFTEPEEPPCAEPVPGMTTDGSAGDGVRISVVDTGLWAQATTSSDTDWLAGVTPADPLDVETVDPNAIHEYAGHGTFVAGIVRCLAPRAAVEVEGALPNGGAVFESKICEQLHQALTDRSDPQLISISAGTHTRENMGLLGFEILAENHGLTDGTKGLVVAAAGNDNSRDEFYPAAFPWVVAVGALDEQGNVASYSNYGPWVDVWARGSNLVNAFPEGTYTCYEAPNKGQVRNFKFLAQWSGTSFATPIVTGAIAAQMSASGNTTDPRKAFDELDKAASVVKDGKAGGKKHLGPL
ncbi:S8 family serine peptidase [Nocardioides humilatus]|uniref:S8 family serine peptidase n=1 Tax=Nocardioides humilatus TaxID=2607660 RepID=A0A5B1LKI0_9ACTN|nr:S8 family serine peptidase [Nocardioides humilatus]KAA1420260.1 S8 family serine peptidase [Nocardioides humilatus]